MTPTIILLIPTAGTIQSTMIPTITGVIIPGTTLTGMHPQYSGALGICGSILPGVSAGLFTGIVIISGTITIILTIRIIAVSTILTAVILQIITESMILQDIIPWEIQSTNRGGVLLTTVLLGT